MPGVCPRHLDAAAVGRCERCGDHLCQSCSVFGCDELGCPYRTVEGGEAWNVAVPWEARAELGSVAALAHTWRRALFDPWRFYSQLGPPKPGAMLYGSLVGGLSLALGLSWLASREEELAALPLVLVILAAPFAAHLRLLVLAASGWVVLSWSGRRPSWAQVSRVTGYTASVDAVLGVPGVGWALVPFVGAGFRALGFRRALGVPWRWATLAAAGPSLATGLLVLGGYALMLWFTG